MIFSGLLGGLVSGLVIDNTKKFKETGVVCLTLALLCLIWFVEVSTCNTNIHSYDIIIVYRKVMYSIYLLFIHQYNSMPLLL